MEDTRKEMERIQRGLLTDEETAMSLDEILADEELNALLNEKPAEPAFDDPEKIHDPREPLVYNNFANDYGAPPVSDSKKRRDDSVVVGLMITASVLSLGIIGILSYWLTVLL